MIFESIYSDLRYSLRVLRRYPGFTAIAIISVALGIGANTAIFTLLDAVVFRPLPVVKPEELVILNHGASGEHIEAFPYSSYTALRDNNRVFSGILAYHNLTLDVAVDGKLDPPTTGMLVSGTYFGTLGIGAEIGRTLTPSDDLQPGAHPVCLLSYGYWKRRFGGDRQILNRTIVISGAPFTVVGVTPESFFGLEVGKSPDVTAPLTMQAQVMPGVERLTEQTQLNDWLHVVGRLKPEITHSQALASLQVLYAGIVQELVTRFANENPKYVQSLASQRLNLSSGERGISKLRGRFSTPLAALMVFVGLVLLIACANVANLLLAKAAAQMKETTIRVSLGASPWRLIRQHFTESILLACLGGALGLLIAFWGIKGLLALAPEGEGAIRVSVSADSRVILFTLAVSVLTGLIFGLAPVAGSRRGDLASMLREKSGALAVGSYRQLIGKLLIVSQVILSVILLIGAGLLFRTLQKLRNIELGFRSDNVLVTRLAPVGSDRKDAQLTLRYERLLREIEVIPGVRAASLVGSTPIAREGWSIASGGRQVMLPDGSTGAISAPVTWQQVFPGSFEVLNIPLLTGRDFGTQDVGRFSSSFAGSPPLSPDADKEFQSTVIVNRAFARRMFGDVNPVGRRFLIGGRRVPQEVEVIGVVGDARFGSLRQPMEPMIFMPFSQAATGRGQMTLEALIAGDPAATIAEIRRVLQQFEPSALPFPVERLKTQVDASIAKERLVAWLAGAFAALALALAGIGLYGLTSYAVARRTGEIGVRLALGATPGEVRRLVLRDVLLLIGVGVAIGVPAAIAASKLLTMLLYDVKVTDPIVIGITVAVMFAIGCIAGYIPALRASRVNPIIALRSE